MVKASKAFFPWMLLQFIHEFRICLGPILKSQFLIYIYASSFLYRLYFCLFPSPFSDGCVSVFLDVGIKSPFQRRKPKNTILLKKQVKFTDDLKCCSDVLTIVAENGKVDPKVFVDNDPSQGLLSFSFVDYVLIEFSNQTTLN